MPSDRFRHAIVCLAGFTDFRQRIQRPDVEVYSLDKKPGKDLRAYGRLWRLLRRLRPDIVHTRNLGTVDMQWIACAAGTKHRIHGEHGWDAADATGTNIKNLRIRKACRCVIRRYAAVSRDLAMWLQNKVGVEQRRITQIYNGVDTERFSSVGPVPTDTPWTKDGAGRPFVFGTVGRLDPIKNQVGLLEAFAQLVRVTAADVSRVRLVIAGDGAMNAKLRTRVTELGLEGYVWLPGARNDVAALMRAFDVFVLPSLNEGISNTILEAMASSKPVVAGSVGGNVELVAAESGRLYDTHAGDGLLQALLWYWQNQSQAAAHGKAGRERVLKQFSLDAMVRGYVDLYNNLLMA